MKTPSDDLKSLALYVRDQWEKQRDMAWETPKNPGIVRLSVKLDHMGQGKMKAYANILKYITDKTELAEALLIVESYC